MCVSSGMAARDGPERKGSAARRAHEIRAIYEMAAPIPGTINTELALRFMTSVREIVQEAVRVNGGTMRLAEAA